MSLRMPAMGKEPDFTGMGAFKPVKLKEEAVQHALQQHP